MRYTDDGQGSPELEVRPPRDAERAIVWGEV
jgi:hypothetical protein